MDRPELNAAQAADFVRRLGEHLQVNINIMDRNGVIIASRDPSRVGTFHEAAHRLIASGRAVESIRAEDPASPGVKPGVNLPILYRGEPIGVVGLTGDPDLVGPLAYAVKTSVETMAEFGLYKERMLRRQIKKNLLLNILLYEDDAPLAEMESLARNLGYGARIPRAPILIRPTAGLDPAQVLRAIKSSPLHGSEDISAMTPDGALLVFKAIDLSQEAPMASFEAQIRSYLKEVRQSMDGDRESKRVASRRSSRTQAPVPLRCFVGMFQMRFSRYRGGYRQVLWLAENRPGATEPILFLHRNLTEYMASRVPRSDLTDTFAPLASLLPASFTEDFAPLVEALYESAFNGKEAAARLGVHRNTLASHIERLGAFLGRDPRHDPRARELAIYLVRYLEIANRKR